MKNQKYFFGTLILISIVFGGLIAATNPTSFTLFLLATCAGLLIYLSALNIRLRR